MKKQVVVIHGGDTFETHEAYLKFLRDWKIDFEEFKNPESSWKSSLQEKLWPDYEVIRPEMPNSINARYEEWKIWFEKFVPYLHDGVILIGHSLGGAFLGKYLSEIDFPKKIKAVFLVAACFGDKLPDYKALDFHALEDMSKLSSQAGKIFLYHSKDDPVVLFTNLAKFQEKLPNATARVFEDKGHFRQEEFPELVDTIKSLG